MIVLSDELLARLRKGDRPKRGRSLDVEALLEAAKALGFVPMDADMLGENTRNRVIDALDRDYPGWRGYRVEQTEGKG